VWTLRPAAFLTLTRLPLTYWQIDQLSTILLTFIFVYLVICLSAREVLTALFQQLLLNAAGQSAFSIMASGIQRFERVSLVASYLCCGKAPTRYRLLPPTFVIFQTACAYSDATTTSYCKFKRFLEGWLPARRRKLSMLMIPEIRWTDSTSSYTHSIEDNRWYAGSIRLTINTDANKNEELWNTSRSLIRFVEVHLEKWRLKFDCGSVRATRRSAPAGHGSNLYAYGFRPEGAGAAFAQVI